MRKNAKRLLGALLVFACVFCLFGCADLGAYADEEAFYASFGDVYFVCPSDTDSPEILAYPLSDLSNKESQRDNKTVMPEDYYKYVVFQTLSDINADDLALWFVTEQEFSGNVRMEVYLSDALADTYFPNKAQAPYAGRYERRTTDGLTETVTKLNFDGEGNADDGNGHSAAVVSTGTDGKYNLAFSFSYTEGDTEKTVSYACFIESPYTTLHVRKTDGGTVTEADYTFASEYEPTPEAGLTHKIAEDSAYAKTGEWTSFFVERWISGGEMPSRYTIPKDTYIYVKILNNCTGAGRKNLSPIAFRANNLLLRVVN